MPAKIPPATRRKIAAMRAKGARIDEVAAATGVHRATAAKYVKQIDKAQALEISGLAVATLADAEVVDLKTLSEQLCRMPCGYCPGTIWFLESSVVVRCPACLQMMELPVEQPKSNRS